MGMGKPKNDVITPEETMELIRLQQVMNNPEVTNRFGQTTTTFDANDQAHITQTLSPEMERLVDMQMDFVGRGPQSYQRESSPYHTRMMEGFGNRLAQRGGFETPAPYDFTQAPENNGLPGQNMGPPAPTNTGNAPNPNGTPSELGWDWRPEGGGTPTPIPGGGMTKPAMLPPPQVGGGQAIGGGAPQNLDTSALEMQANKMNPNALAMALMGGNRRGNK